MTKFSFEVPINHLEDFEDLQDFHFTLSILYKNPHYCKFIQDQMYKGLKTIWLDNSFNETLKADNMQDLVPLTREYNFTKVIAPDDPKWSARKIYNSYDLTSCYVDDYKIITVASNKKIYNYLKTKQVQHIASPFRTRLDNTMEQLQYTKQCHFLGLTSVYELEILHPPSCDTSMPIKLALIGYSISSWEQMNCPHIYTHEQEDFFNITMTANQIQLARKNIKEIKRRTNNEE